MMILHAIHILFFLMYLQNILVYHCLKKRAKKNYAIAKHLYENARKHHLKDYHLAKSAG